MFFCMKAEVKKGAVYGIVFAGLNYLVIEALGFNRTSLSLILYLNVLMGIVINVSASDLGLEKFLGNVLVAVEGEEMKLKKVFTGEEYVLNGNIEKVE